MTTISNVGFHTIQTQHKHKFEENITVADVFPASHNPEKPSTTVNNIKRYKYFHYLLMLLIFKLHEMNIKLL